MTNFFPALMTLITSAQKKSYFRGGETFSFGFMKRLTFIQFLSE